MASVLLVAAVFLVPVILDPRTNDSFNLIKITTLWVLLAGAAAVWFLSTRLAHIRIFPRSHLVITALVLLGVTALATVFSPNRSLSLHGLYHRYEGFAAIGMYVALLLLMVLLYRGRVEKLREIVIGVGLAAGVVGAYVLIQKLGVDPIKWQELSGEAPSSPIGNLGNTSFTASYLGIASPFVLYLIFSSRAILLRLVWALVGVLVVLGLGFTQGRAGIIAAIIGVAALLLFTSRIGPITKLAAVVLVLVALALMPFVVGDPTDTGEEGLLQRGPSSTRTDVWGTSWRMTMGRPLLGWGPESFFGEYGEYRSVADARRLGLSLTDKPHNIFLGWSTSTGLIGVGVYIVLVLSALFLVARATANTKDRARRMLLASFGAGLVGYLAQGIFSIDVPPLAFMGWLALGGITAALDGGTGQDGLRAESKGQSWVAGGLVLLIALVAIGLGVSPLRADYQARSAQNRVSLGWSADVFNMFTRAIGLDPRESAYRGLAGSYLEQVAEDDALPFTSETALRRAAQYYEEAIELQPRNIYFMINAGRVYARLGSDDSRFFSQADSWLSKAVALDPFNPQNRDLHASLLEKWARETDDDGDADKLSERAKEQRDAARAIRQGRVIGR